MRLLLAEDEPAIARHLREALEAAGYVVDHAADGEEAHFLGDTEPYDAIVLDLGLPKVDGVSVLERWRKDGVATPVLILTARASLDGEPLRLTSLEYRLLHYLMMHQGRVISRTELVEHLYDQDFDRDSNTIEVFVGRLRKKIGSDRIETVRGLGYRLAVPPGEAG